MRVSVHQTLAAILRPFSVEEFLDHYFGQRPLLVRGTPRKFDLLMKPTDFIYKLDRVSEIRCVFDGLKQATIGPGDVREMFEAGATICVTGIDRAHPSLRLATRRIQRELGYAGRIDFRAYLSPPGSGFDVHYDARVATSLQLDGTKTWWYSDQPHTPFPLENSSRADMPAIRRAVAKVRFHKVTLRPGDLLCLPPGVWHKARAGSGGSFALNMAFNHAGATVLDVVLGHIHDLLHTTVGCREPFFSAQRNGPHAQLRSNLEPCLAAIMRELTSVPSDALTRRFARSSVRPITE
jgi:ribosomal protein L16 Arg81 hydroxylase